VQFFLGQAIDFILQSCGTDKEVLHGALVEEDRADRLELVGKIPIRGAASYASPKGHRFLEQQGQLFCSGGAG
jgi:hypothetical protein